MNKQPLVSVIVPTKNSSTTLLACLESIKAQLYSNIELVVVDNHSIDKTPAIAEQLSDKFYTRGPERSAQRNFGVSKSAGEYVLIIDSDMVLAENVVSQCVEQFQNNKMLNGIVIPEESFGEGFWAECKRLERSFYVGVSWMEAARAFKKSVYVQVGGYNELMTSGEDWDLSQRIEKKGNLSRIEAYILHNEGRLHLMRTLSKKYYYAQKIDKYTSNSKGSLNYKKQMNPINRYWLFLSKPDKLLRNPFIGCGMLLMKTLEFGFGFVGHLAAKS